MTSPSETPPVGRWAAFQNSAFMTYWLSRVASSFAMQIQTVAVGWQVYDLTRDPLDLGLVGLSQFLPALLLVLVTGAVADRFRRRTIMAVCIAIEALCAAALLAFTQIELHSAVPIFIVLGVFGTARAFYGPAQQSLVPNLVPPQILSSAIALNSLSWQFATITGPVAGGLLYGVSPQAAYGTAAVLFVHRRRPDPARAAPDAADRSREPANWETIVAGFRYIWHEKIVLGAISLDLFAVLLGGATALLPVYARDILEVGPWGLGLLRSGPAIGAIAVALYLTTHPLRDHAGLVMFVCVGVFGLGDDRLRRLDDRLALGRRADRHGRRRHGERLRARDADPAVDAGSGARPRQCGERRSSSARRTSSASSAPAFRPALIGTVPAVVIGGIGTLAVDGALVCAGSRSFAAPGISSGRV